MAAPTATTSSGLTDWFGSLPPGELPDESLHRGGPGGAADQDDLVDVALGELGIGQGLLEGPHAALHEVRRELVELRPRELHLEVLGPRGVCRDEGQADAGLDLTRQLDLGLLGGLRQPLQRLAILAQVDALVALELLGHPVHDALVEVVASQVGVAGRGLDLEDAVADLEQGDVEGAPAQIEDEDRLVALLVEAVGEGRSRRLVDDAQHVQAGDGARVLGGLALGVVEVRGDRDHGVGHLLTQVAGGVLGELAQDLGRDLLGSVELARHVEADRVARARDDREREVLDLGLDFGIAAADEALGRVDRVLGVEHGLASRQLPTSRSPFLANPTTEAVRRLPSLLMITVG